MRDINLYSGTIIGSDQAPFKSGMESEIYLYSNPKYYDEEVIYKRLRSWKHFIEFDIPILGDYPENKRKKLELIQQMKCFSDEVKILDAVTEFGKFVGYTMEKCPYPELNANADISLKIKVLKQLREKLRKLNYDGAFVGDFNAWNILTPTNGEDLVLCDLDNYRVDNLDFDIKNSFVRKYEENCNIKDGVDSYVFNIFTLALLTNSLNTYIARYLSEMELPEELDTRENRDIIDSMNDLDHTYQPRFLIDNLK